MKIKTRYTVLCIYATLILCVLSLTFVDLSYAFSGVFGILLTLPWSLLLLHLMPPTWHGEFNFCFIIIIGAIFNSIIIWSLCVLIHRMLGWRK